jgi:hypothetical protein
VDVNGVDGNTSGLLILTFDANATALYLNFTLLGVNTTVDALVFETFCDGNFVDSNSVTAVFTAGNSVGSLAYSGAPFNQVYLFFAVDGPNFIATDINYYDPTQLPGAPTIGTATGSNAQATVDFNAPASDGGFAITSYTVTSSPGGLTGTGASSPITVTGLTNGTGYTFTVTATNIAGTGPASAPSSPPVIPLPIAPGAPSIGTATAGNAQATVGFTAPASDGGSAITHYTATSSPGGLTGTGASSPITVTGLTNGTAYTFTVTATNNYGTSTASHASNTVTPTGSTPPPTATTPGAPTIGTAVAGNAQATVSFTAPASDGGSAITSYTVTSSPDGRTGTGTGSPITVTGLTNGTAYTFTVTATNGVGMGAASAASNSVTPAAAATVPGAPTIGTAVAGNAQATVSFTAPASDGGSAITSYTVTSSPGGLTGTGTASPITVTGLTNGTAYTFTVTATNAIGTGPASSPSNSVTPAAPTVAPAAPEIQAAAASALSSDPPSVNLRWVDKSDNEAGFKIQRATNTKFTAGLTTFTVGANVTTYTDTAVLSKTKYYYRIKAYNAIGDSAYTKVIKVTTAGQLPAAPTNLATGTVTEKSVVLTWTDNATNETGFKIQRSTNAAFTKGVTTTTVKKPNLTTRTMSIGRNKTYYCRVAAYNKSGNSEWSNVVTMTTALP